MAVDAGIGGPNRADRRAKKYYFYSYLNKGKIHGAD